MLLNIIATIVIRNDDDDIANLLDIKYNGTVVANNIIYIYKALQYIYIIYMLYMIYDTCMTAMYDMYVYMHKLCTRGFAFQYHLSLANYIKFIKVVYCS